MYLAYYIVLYTHKPCQYLIANTKNIKIHNDIHGVCALGAFV